MRLRINKEDDALYFRLDETQIIESEEVEPGVILDSDAEGRVVGIEMLGLSTRNTAAQISHFSLRLPKSCSS